MTRTTHRLTAGRACDRGPFDGPFKVRCESAQTGVFYLQGFSRAGFYEIRFQTIKAARAAARDEYERQRTRGRTIDARIVDARGRIVDAFTAGGPWESTQPENYPADCPARIALIYPGNEQRFMPGAYRTLRGAQRAARAAFRAALGMPAASGNEAGSPAPDQARTDAAGPDELMPIGVRVIDTSLNDWDCPDGAIWAELYGLRARWTVY